MFIRTESQTIYPLRDVDEIGSPVPVGTQPYTYTISITIKGQQSVAATCPNWTCALYLNEYILSVPQGQSIDIWK